MKAFRVHFLIMVLCCGQSVKAATDIVEWGGTDMVSAHNNLVLLDYIDHDDIRLWKGREEALHAASGMYGILQNKSGTEEASDFVVARITDDINGDYLQIYGNNTAENTITGLIFFKPDVPEGTTISFDEESSLKVEIKILLYTLRTFRLAVLSDGVWYLSQTQVTGMTTFEIENAAAEIWGVWDGLENAEYLPEIPAAFVVSGAELTNIQAVGFYFSASASDAANGARLGIPNFNAKALVTPNSN